MKTRPGIKDWVPMGLSEPERWLIRDQEKTRSALISIAPNLVHLSELSKTIPQFQYLLHERDKEIAELKLEVALLRREERFPPKKTSGPGRWSKLVRILKSVNNYMSKRAFE